MGLNNNQRNHTPTIYLNIVGGKITRRYKEHQPEENGAPVTFSRDIKDKNTGQVVKTVIERYYDEIEGHIQEAKIDTEGSFGSTLVFKIVDDEEYTLTIPLDSSYGIAIMKKIPNINPASPVTFAPFNFESKDQMDNSGNPKKIVGCNLFQNNTKIEPKWTSENPGSLPKWKKSETTGKWDNTEFLEFLGGHFKQWAKNVDPLAVPERPQQVNTEVEMDMNPMEIEQQFAEQKAAKENTPPAPQQNDSEKIDDLPF